MRPAPIALWHHAVAMHDLAAVDLLLADDAVFQSPAVHAPQIGKPLVSKYLHAALEVLNNPTFTYVDEWYGDHSAVLEFEATIDGVYVNGIDLIRWDEHDRIVHFKVMVRPLKALDTVVALMGSELGATARS